MQNHRKRLEKVQTAIAATPLPLEAVRQAFERFRETGELPEHRRLAAAVVVRARNGVDLTDESGRPMGLAEAVQALSHAPSRPDDRVMSALYSEAVCETAIFRDAARAVLVQLAEIGFDVTEPEFAKRGIEIDLPKFGTVGLHLLGFPECLAVPPYEEQAKRLFDRFAVLRTRVGSFGKQWFAELARAVEAFRLDGELPEDELLRDVVLADAELVCLIRHWMGQDVAVVMTALAEAQVDPAREGAVARLQELVRDGRIRPLVEAVGFRPVQ